MITPNEDDIIKILQNKFGKYGATDLFKDDVSTMSVIKGDLVSKVDMLVGKTDVPSGMKMWQVSRKSIVACISDFAAKGVRPSGVLISLGIPRNFTRNDVIQLGIGFRKACEEFDLRILGGDTNEADDIVIDCCMLGFSDKAVKRKGAKVGDKLIVSGPFGYSSLGLKLIEKNIKVGGPVIRRALNSVYMPNPKLDLGFSIAQSGYVSASIDSSDGLAISLHQLGEASNVGFRVSSLPVTDELMKLGKSLEMNVNDLVLYGGEEYEIVATINKDRIRDVRNLAKKSNHEILEIGEVIANSGEIIYDDDSERYIIKKKGWTHLS